jgi:type I restriction enzyme M protein
MDASEFKDYIFGMLFLKRLSDAFDEAREGVIQYYLDKGKTQEQAEELADDKDEYDKTFYVPEKGRWENLKDLKHDIGAELNKATEAIEEQNPILEGVLAAIDFNNKNKLTDKKLRDLLSHYSTFRLRSEDFERPDLLGAAYEYLIKMFADSAGKKGGEFYTPSEVVKLLVSLLKPHAGMKVYDPTCGSGGMLIETRNYLTENGDKAANLQLFGQENNLSTWAICKLNLFLHGVFSADIRKGDTIRDPKHTEEGRLQKFDCVIANPPFSLKQWGREEASEDEFNRFEYGIPPADAGDLAFVQHMLASTTESGKVCVVVPHGVLFRGGSEGKIRKKLIEEDLIECVIGLAPRLFYGTDLPGAILVFNKEKTEARKGRILMVNAEKEYIAGKKQDQLSEGACERITKAYDAFLDQSFYSHVITKEEIAENDFNLNIRRYVDTSMPPEDYDLEAILVGGIPANEFERIRKSPLAKKFFAVKESGRERYQFEDDTRSLHEFTKNFATEKREDAVIFEATRVWEKYRYSVAESLRELGSRQDSFLSKIPSLSEDAISELLHHARTMYMGDVSDYKRLRVSEFLEQRKEKGAGNLPIYSVTIKEGMIPRYSLNKMVMSDLADEDNLIARRGDFCYNMMRMWQGASGIAPEDCLVSPAYVVCQCKDNVIPEYIALLMKTEASIKYLARYSQGIAQDKWRLYFDIFSGMKFPIPPKEQQAEIVSCIESTKNLNESLAKLSKTLGNFIHSFSNLTCRVEMMPELWE